ncbi:MAG TPA: FliA/WhiG family RNA polymerase sigma factor [Bacteroidota bacterium]|nr:FliA/WhiG family RNA polymerase sigma factor [Bacteroidota bacterium]
MQQLIEKEVVAERHLPAGIRKKIFLENLGLVNFVVNKIGLTMFRSSAALERSDLVQFGIIGLLDAIERFDPSRGVQFQTYAVSRIKGSVQDELRKLDWVPRSVRKAERHADLIAQRAGQAEDRTTTASDLARRLSITIEQFADILNHVNRMPVASADSPEYSTRLNALSTDEKEDPSEITQEHQMKEVIVSALEHLAERDRLVIMLYYYEDLTFKEIAAVLRVSESRVFQIHAKILRDLKTMLKELE